MKVHLSHIPSWSKTPRARCGLSSAAEVQMTDDPGQVTCLTCEKRLNEDLEPVDERIERESYQKARNRARSRAVTELVERHHREFEQIWDDFTEDLIEDARAEVESDVEARDRWDAERIKRRRAELERELEALG